MRIGLVAYWFNRGQAVVARQLRSALEELGHETYVLARPTRRNFVRPLFIDHGDVWDQPRVTEGSAYEMSADEYLQWARQNGLEMVMFDQNRQVAEVAALRRSGVVTVGRFTWESFGEHDLARGVQSAYDVIYSVTRCEQARYAEMGIDSPYVPWGCFPDLVRRPHFDHDDKLVRFYYPGGYLSRRKPTESVLKAFMRVYAPQARLVVKVQHDERGARLTRRAVSADPRIRVIVGDLPDDDHFKLFSEADVSLAPSRWEGLGLHLYEAVALGIPTITNDAPPMNEVVSHDVDGWLVPSKVIGWRQHGVPSLEPKIEPLAAAIRALCDDRTRARLVEGVRVRQKERDWANTVAGLGKMINQITAEVVVR